MELLIRIAAMMNIMISVDKNYLDKALTMLFSLRRHI